MDRFKIGNLAVESLHFTASLTELVDHIRLNLRRQATLLSPERNQISFSAEVVDSSTSLKSASMAAKIYLLAFFHRLSQI